MNIANYRKEPDSITPYEIDWEEWLAGRTLATSTWDADGLTIEDESNTSTVAAVQLSGGDWGDVFEVTNHIVASDASEESRTITIIIQQEQRYCTPAEVRRRGSQTTTTALPDPELEALIEQASRIFDQAANVEPGYFNPPAIPIATNKTVYGTGVNYLQLDPYVAGSLSITYPEGYTAPTFIERDGYLVFTTSTGFVPPFIDTYGWLQGIPITVSAIWGYQSTPEDVKAAVIELAINLWRETDPGSLKLTGIDNQPIREKLPPRVGEIARRYRARQIAII